MHDPAALDGIEQRYQRELWRTAVTDTVVERRLDLARFGPVQAGIVCEEPGEPMLNAVLGAGAFGAVEGGHLADAIEWVTAHGVDYRVPVTPGSPGSRAAEQWLMERGHEQGRAWTKFARDTSPAAAEELPGVDVFELRDEEEICEGFMHLDDDGFWGARWLGSYFSELVGRDGWRCYAAYEGEDRESSSGAVMLVEGRSAELGALLRAEDEDAELQEALIRRCTSDAAEAGCRAIFAEAAAGEDDGPAGPTAVLLSAGFRPIFTRTDWRPPRIRRDGSFAMPEEGLEPPTRGL
jgi:hypothetical protein